MNHPPPQLRPVPAVGTCTIIKSVVIAEQQDPNQLWGVEKKLSNEQKESGDLMMLREQNEAV